MTNLSYTSGFLLYEAGGQVVQKVSEKKSNGFEETAAFCSLDQHYQQNLLYSSSTLAHRINISLYYTTSLQVSEDLHVSTWETV